MKEFIKKDKSCFINIETGCIEYKGKKENIPAQVANMLIYLLVHKEEKCEFRNIYDYIRGKSTNIHKELEPYDRDIIKNTRKEITRKLKVYDIRVATKVDQIENADITILCIQDSYQLYLGADYSSKETLFTLRNKIARLYFEKYKEIIPVKNIRKIYSGLFDIFCYPRIEGNKKIELSTSNNIYVCAPNGFGKSILLKTLLLSSNPSNEAISAFGDKINEIRENYSIEKEYLSLFIDLKKVNSIMMNITDVYEWLLKMSELDYQQDLKICVEEFRELIDWYNHNSQLIIIFDSFDEITDKNLRDSVDNMIRNLNGASGICANAKIIMASRPLVFQNLDKPYDYVYIDSLRVNTDIEKIKRIIHGYTKEHSEECLGFILRDRYLKDFIITPQLLTEVIVSFLQNKNYEKNQLFGLQKSIYKIIDSITQNTMMRFQNRQQMYDAGPTYMNRPEKHIYEIFSYISLFNSIDNNMSVVETLFELIMDNILPHGEKFRGNLMLKDIVTVYEHCSLLSTHKDKLTFVAEKVLTPYFLSNYIYKYFKYEERNTENSINKKWRMFDEISNNRLKNDEILYDMLVFYFAKLNDYLPEGPAYDAWIDYVVFKWKSETTSKREKELLKDRIKYLLESKFIIDSRLDRLFDDNQELQDNEIELRQVIKSIRND